MKNIVLIYFFTLFFSTTTHALPINGDIHLPVLGTILEQSSNDKGVKYVVSSDILKAHSPMDGSIYYVGSLDEYGLSVIIKNAHNYSIVGNLDRISVIKNQYVLQGDALGSVAYHSKVTLIVQQIRRVLDDNNPQQQNSIQLAQNFQDKLLAFAKKGGNFLHSKNQKFMSTNKDNTLNYSQISTLLKDTGFPQHVIPTMYCIAKWESGLNPKALNFNSNNTVDVGLFQINSSWFKKCNANIATLYDEKENSRCALTVLQNQGFPAWTTYNKYKNTNAFCTM